MSIYKCRLFLGMSLILHGVTSNWYTPSLLLLNWFTSSILCWINIRTISYKKHTEMLRVLWVVNRGLMGDDRDRDDSAWDDWDITPVSLEEIALHTRHISGNWDQSFQICRGPVNSLIIFFISKRITPHKYILLLLSPQLPIFRLVLAPS